MPRLPCVIVLLATMVRFSIALAVLTAVPPTDPVRWTVTHRSLPLLKAYSPLSSRSRACRHLNILWTRRYWCAFPLTSSILSLPVAFSWHYGHPRVCEGAHTFATLNHPPYGER